ncbi:MAG: YaiI/YqxD family protein [Betaproteobacteria bacterium]|nr:YaiI/YqxD family protein [Betaproteobacteria bacterium]
MHIWVDADACPAVIKDILFRAADRMQVPLTLVANRLLRVPPSPYIRVRQVPMGFDVADRHIVEEVAEGDLVITADIPLAAALIEEGAFVLSPRGECYSAENIRERLGLRDFMEGLRGAGADIGGPAALSPADRQAFARQLDRFLARRRVK